MNDSVTTIHTLIRPVTISAGEDERDRHLHDLRRQHHVAPIAPVGDDAADQREQQDRHFAGEAVEAEIKRRRCAGQRDDQPRLRHLLHPRADARRERAQPKQPEITVGEGDRDAGRGVIDSIAQRDSILCDISPHEEYRSDPPPLHGDVRGSRIGLYSGARHRLGPRAGRRGAESHARDGQRGPEALGHRGPRRREDQHRRERESQPDRLRGAAGSSTFRPTCRRRSTSAR